MKKEEKKNADSQKESVNAKTPDVEKTISEATMGKIKNLKLRLALKVSPITDDFDVQMKIHELLDEAVDETFSIGQAAGMTPEQVKTMTNAMKEYVDVIANPTDSARAEKYRTLYLAQRMVSSNLISALQHSEVMTSIYESGDGPFSNPFQRGLTKALGLASDAVSSGGPFYELAKKD